MWFRAAPFLSTFTLQHIFWPGGISACCRNWEHFTLQSRNLDYNLEMVGDQFPRKFAAFSCCKCIEMSTNSSRNEAKNPFANISYIMWENYQKTPSKYLKTNGQIWQFSCDMSMVLVVKMKVTFLVVPFPFHLLDDVQVEKRISSAIPIYHRYQYKENIFWDTNIFKVSI